MKLREFLQIAAGDQIDSIAELKLYSDAEKNFNFTNGLDTELEFKFETGGFTVYEKNNEDNILLDYVDYENWFNVAEIEYLENEFSKELEPCFKVGDTTYFLNEFLSYYAFNKDYKGLFDGYLILNNFGGLEIKLIDNNDAVFYHYNY